MNYRMKSFIGMGFTAIIWTSGFPLITHSLKVIGPFTLIFIRFAIALIALTIFQKMRHIQEKIHREDMIRMISNGVVGSIIYFGISNLTSIYLPNVDSAALSSMQLILMLWGESMVLGNIVTPKRAFYVVLATIGGILLMRAITISSAIIMAYSLMLVATCFWVMYSIIQLPLLKKYHPTTVIKNQAFYSVLFTFPIVFLERNPWHMVEVSHVTSMLFLGLFGIAICYTFNSYALKYIGPTNTSLLLIFQPIIILLSDLIIVGRGFVWSDYLGLVCILIGIILMVLDLKNKKIAYYHKLDDIENTMV